MSNEKDLFIQKCLDVMTFFNSVEEFELHELEEELMDLKDLMGYVDSQEDLFYEMIWIIEEQYNLLQTDLLDYNKDEVLYRFSELTSLLKLDTFATSSIPPFTAECLLPHLHNMINLTTLTIETDVIENISNLEDYIVRGVREMPDLKHFTLHYHCTNRIINEVSQNCAHLETLDVKSSFAVEDKGIKYLTECKNLKSVQLVDTSVSPLGFLRLLITCPNLASVGLFDFLNNVFELLYRKNIIFNSDLYLNVTNLQIGGITSFHVKCISQLCPELTTLHMNCVSDESIDFTYLSKLNQLQDLGIINAEFKDIKSYLNSRNKISALKLVSVSQVDLIALNESCLRIKDLMIHDCTFETLDSKSTQYWKRCLNGVQNLVLGDNIPEKELKYLLSNCQNVQVVHLMDRNGVLTNENFREILKENKFNSLEEFHLGENTSLTATSLNLLVETCKNLEKITGLHYCRQLSELGVGLFKRINKHLQIGTRNIPEFYIHMLNMENF